MSELMNQKINKQFDPKTINKHRKEHKKQGYQMKLISDKNYKVTAFYLAKNGKNVYEKRNPKLPEFKQYIKKPFWDKISILIIIAILLVGVVTIFAINNVDFNDRIIIDSNDSNSNKLNFKVNQEKLKPYNTTVSDLDYNTVTYLYGADRQINASALGIAVDSQGYIHVFHDTQPFPASANDSIVVYNKSNHFQYSYGAGNVSGNGAGVKNAGLHYSAFHDEIFVSGTTNMNGDDRRNRVDRYNITGGWLGNFSNPTLDIIRSITDITTNDTGFIFVLSIHTNASGLAESKISIFYSNFTYFDSYIFDKFADCYSASSIAINSNNEAYVYCQYAGIEASETDYAQNVTQVVNLNTLTRVKEFRFNGNGTAYPRVSIDFTFDADGNIWLNNKAVGEQIEVRDSDFNLLYFFDILEFNIVVTTGNKAGISYRIPTFVTAITQDRISGDILISGDNGITCSGGYATCSWMSGYIRLFRFEQSFEYLGDLPTNIDSDDVRIDHNNGQFDIQCSECSYIDGDGVFVSNTYKRFLVDTRFNFESEDIKNGININVDFNLFINNSLYTYAVRFPELDSNVLDHLLTFNFSEAIDFQTNKLYFRFIIQQIYNQHLTVQIEYFNHEDNTYVSGLKYNSSSGNFIAFPENFVLYFRKVWIENFDYTIDNFQFTDNNYHITFTSNTPATFTIYENDTFISTGNFIAGQQTISQLKNTNPNSINFLGIALEVQHLTFWFNTTYINPSAQAIILDLSPPIQSDNLLQISITSNYKNAQYFLDDDLVAGIEVNWGSEGVYAWDVEDDYGTHNITVKARIDHNSDSDYNDLNENTTRFITFNRFEKDLIVYNINFDADFDQQVRLSFTSNYKGKNKTEFRVKASNSSVYTAWVKEDVLDGTFTFDTTGLVANLKYQYKVDIRANITKTTVEVQTLTYQFFYVVLSNAEVRIVKQDDVVTRVVIPDITLPEQLDDNIGTLNSKADQQNGALVLIIVLVSAIILGVVFQRRVRKLDKRLFASDTGVITKGISSNLDQLPQRIETLPEDVQDRFSGFSRDVSRRSRRLRKRL